MPKKKSNGNSEDAFEKAKSEFLVVAAHQLRTPLAPIKLFTEMMLEGSTGELSKVQREYLLKIQQATERMIKLVNDLLAVSRLEVGVFHIRPEETDLEKLIKKTIENAEEKFSGHGCDIRFQRPERKLPDVKVDERLLHTVLQAVLDNAVLYSKKGKCSILVGLEKGEREYIIKIEDDGIGIPTDSHPRIFTKFFREGNAVKSNTEGLGLSLYAAKEIMERSGGKIWFDSEEGKGSTFFISVPIKGMSKV